MLTDQELIDGLRTELAPLQTPVDLIDRLREHAAADRGQLGVRRRSQLRHPRIAAGSVVVAVSGLVAIAVAVGALLLAGHRSPNPAHTGTTDHQAASERVPTLGQLEANFAVLRRPQTDADRTARTFCPHPCKERLLPGLTRLARTLPDGIKVFLSVWRLQVSKLGQPAGSYALHEDVIPARGRSILDPESLEDVRFEVGGTFAVLPATTTTDGEPAPLWSAIVPDGVSTVRWTFACPHVGPQDRCRQLAAINPVTVDVDVIDNIALARVPGTGSDATGRFLRARSRAAWYASDGRQLANFSSAKPQTIPPFVESNPTGPLITQPGARLVLSGSGIGVVRFGASPDRLQRLLDPALGRPVGGYQTTSDCSVDHWLTWPILLNPVTGGLKRSEEMELFFRHGRFVGYQYGGNILASQGAGRRLRVQATTALGLALGDLLSVGRRLYRQAFQISSAQGGTWHARTAQGTISGYAYGNPKHGDVSPSSQIASIDAGNTGCPSLSP